MEMHLVKAYCFIALFFMSACGAKDDDISTTEEENISTQEQTEVAKELRFVDEYILPDATTFENTIVGGLSGIDYNNDTVYLISDSGNAPIRFYTAQISFNASEITDVSLESVVELKDIQGNSFVNATADPEAIRVSNGSIIWASEGNITNGIAPFVRKAMPDGTFTSEIQLDAKFTLLNDDEKGPRFNGVFEGLSSSFENDGYWVVNELPLKQDGPIPTLTPTNSPVRITFINAANENTEKEFAYPLSVVARPAVGENDFEVNGVVELLSYAENKFYVLERSFSSGYEDGGNSVKIYDVDTSMATDVSGIERLENTSYMPATKELLFDFETIRDQLTMGIVDNIEGISFGPPFANGNASLLLVSDNNFSAFAPQLNQFILLEIVK